METAMEQRNATATLASYGQDAGDFGPETDVDMPDESISLTKPKVEGDANVIDESGEDSEEDGGGWNYYKKSTEGAEKKTYEEGDNNAGNSSDAEDMDYKLNPDAPEFVPVSSPPLSMINHAQRLLKMDNDDFISSSPQKFQESIDSVDVPDENDFTNEIKVHAADLSVINNPCEPNDDSTMLNGIKPLNDVVTGHDETNDSFVFENELITNDNSDKYQNPFVSDEKVDLNKVQDLSEYLNDNAQTYNTDPYVSIMEPPKNNEFNSASGDNSLQNESSVKLNDGPSLGEHMRYESDMNTKIIDDTVNTNDADSTSQLDESLKHSDDFKNEFMDSSHIDKFSMYEDRKLNDSVSTTDAILGSEPHTPMRMDNQSTFESENDDDQFSESFKQQLQFNQFDENNDKENHDPFCFEQIEDPAGIIPNVTHEVSEELDVTHHNDDSSKHTDNSNEHQIPELVKHEPVEEPLCIKEKAKPIHSVYEQQDLPESDFPASNHEALLNTTENENENIVNTEHFDQHDIVESHVENNQEFVERQQVNEHLEQEDSEVDEVKEHAEGLNQEFYRDNTSDFEQENNKVNSVHNQGENLEEKHNDTNNEHEYLEDFKQKDHARHYIQNHFEDLKHHQGIETIKNIEDIKQENTDVAKVLQDNFVTSEQGHYDDAAIQNLAEDFGRECHNNVANNTENSKQQDQFNVETSQNHVDVEVVQSYVKDTEQKHSDNFTDVKHNYVDDFIQKHDVVEPENNYVENFIQHSVVEAEQNHGKDLKQEHDIVDEIIQNHGEDIPQELNGVESVQNHTADSDEEMHSSMIIHSDVENIMPQPYCSSHDTLINEPSDMMCTSMTFEEKFQDRNMSDSLYVMETSSDYFGEEVQQTAQINKSIDEPKVEEQSSNIVNELVEPVKIENKIGTEAKCELVSESKTEEVKVETTELSQLSSDEPVENVVKQEESNKVAEIAVAAAVGTAAIAAVTGVSLASKKSAPKKMETTVSKAKTATTKTALTKPLASKTSAPVPKKTTSSTITSKSLSRPLTAPVTTTSKPTTNLRPTTVPKTTTLKATTVTKAAPKITATALKTTSPASRPTSAKTTPTTPRTLTKTTPTSSSSSPKTSITPKNTMVTKSPITLKTSTTHRTSLTKQPLTNGSPRLSRPNSAPAKKPLNSPTTNGTTKLTNGDVSKTSTAAKSHVTLATRMSLAPPKLPPKVKAAPKTVTPPAMPGPIRRPNPITKKTEATS